MVWSKEYEARYGDTLNVKPLRGKFYHYIVHETAMRLNRGDAPAIAFVGNTNKGKSEAALRFAEIFQDELNMFKGDFTEDQLVYNPLPFLKKMRDITVPDHNDTINEEREIVIFDEAEKELNVSGYHNEMNKAVDDVINTMRIKNCLYLFCAPNFSDIDVRLRKNVDWIVYKETQEAAQPVMREKNHISESKSDATNNLYIDGKWYMDRPSEELREKYHPKDYEHKQNIIEDLVDTAVEKKKEEEKKRKQEKAGDMMEEMMDD